MPIINLTYQLNVRYNKKIGCNMDNNNGVIPGFDNDKDDSLTISLRKAEGVPHGMFIYLSGYIDTYNSSFFQKQIQKVMDAGFINLIFNCISIQRLYLCNSI